MPLLKSNVVFDTNILIALFSKELSMDLFIQRFRECKWIISEITEVEVLSYHALTVTEETEIKEFLRHCKIIRFSRKVKAETIRFRRLAKRKLPDSVIAATAVLSKATLISNDSHLSKAVYPGLFVETLCAPSALMEN